MPFLIPLLLRVGIPSRFGKAAAWVTTALLGLLIVVGGVLILRSVARSHDAGIATEAVSNRDKDLSLEAYNMVVSAGEAANVNQAAREDRAAENTKELQREVDTKGTDGTAGPAVSSVLERVRQQQAAGRRR